MIFWVKLGGNSACVFLVVSRRAKVSAVVSYFGEFSARLAFMEGFPLARHAFIFVMHGPCLQIVLGIRFYCFVPGNSASTCFAFCPMYRPFVVNATIRKVRDARVGSRFVVDVVGLIVFTWVRKGFLASKISKALFCYQVLSRYSPASISLCCRYSQESFQGNFTIDRCLVERDIPRTSFRFRASIEEASYVFFLHFC